MFGFRALKKNREQQPQPQQQQQRTDKASRLFSRKKGERRIGADMPGERVGYGERKEHARIFVCNRASLLLLILLRRQG